MGPRSPLISGPRVSRSDKPSSLSKARAHNVSALDLISLCSPGGAHKRQASLPYGICATICAPFKKCHDLKGMFFFFHFVLSVVFLVQCCLSTCLFSGTRASGLSDGDLAGGRKC